MNSNIRRWGVGRWQQVISIVTILGIHVGHGSSVCLMIDGKMVTSVQQEKFDRIKNSGCFPKEAIAWVIKTFNLTPTTVDAIAMGGRTPLPTANIFGGLFTPINKETLVIKAWRHATRKNKQVLNLLYPLVMKRRAEVGKRGMEEMTSRLVKEFGFPANIIHFVEHHKCHSYAAYYGQRDKSKESIVLTIDGEGDDYSATVSQTNGEEVERVSGTPWHSSLGFIYSQTTTFLGMKALEHEYKVMGLAPYAKEYFKKTYDKSFKSVIDVNEDTLEFVSKFPTSRFLMHLNETAVGERFDNIAAAVQYLTETVVSKWVKAATKKLGKRRLYLGGGVFMNVKLNMKLAELDEVMEIYPFPSCGDESNAFGAAYYVYLHKFGKKANDSQRIKDLYLGPSYTNEYVEEMVKRLELKRKYNVEFYEDMEGEIASRLAMDQIVARVSGKCEWGARSLCNRGILGNPSKMQTFYEVNDQIKMRDFWMPFAPTILKEREEDYIVNPKHIDAPYMIMAFHSTALAQKELVAAIHQADKTCRPQILEKDWNPKCYKIMKEFEKETGIGGILNTSFNLHGEPIVCSPEDAIHTLENSGLKNVAIENYMISKRA